MQLRRAKASRERHDRTGRDREQQRPDQRVAEADARQIARGQEGNDRNRDILETFERACLGLRDMKAGNRLQDHRPDAVEQHREGDIGQNHCGNQTRAGHAKSFAAKRGGREEAATTQGGMT